MSRNREGSQRRQDERKGMRGKERRMEDERRTERDREGKRRGGDERLE